MVKRKEHSHKGSSWREFENLVARLETALSPRGAIVRAPDRLLDHVSQSLREVDASITYKVGTAAILIIIECRERTRVQDALWIEQLASKQQHLRAAKCIAVTSSGFTKAAVKLADAHGIELRHLRRITDDQILRWAPLRTWFYNYTLSSIDLSFSGKVDVSGIDHDLDRRSNEELMRRRYTLEDRVFICLETGAKLSVREYCEDMMNSAIDSLAPEERLLFEIDKEYIMSFAGPPRHYLRLSRRKVYPFAVAFRVAFKWIEDYSIQPVTSFAYADSSKDLVTGQEFDAVSSRTANVRRIALHHDLIRDERKVSIWEVTK